MPVLFYATNQPFGCFSNFSPHPIDLDGQTWPTSEHYFQAQKSPDSARREEIRSVASPMVAARMGRSRKHPIPADWESVKDAVMRRAVLRKFESHAEIRAVLLSTGDEEIIEETTNDYYWGCGTERTGKNMLGRILMETRTILRERGL
jgi:N-glycosidase YbiA